mgnify:CR=1 FL=1
MPIKTRKTKTPESLQDEAAFLKSEHNLKQIFETELPNSKILVIGDLILDKYVFGTADRLSPESPVPVLNIERETYRLGGAANVLANLSGLGVTPWVAGILGKDEDAEIVRKMMKSLVRDMRGLFDDKTRPTTKKTRFLANHQQLLRADQETNTEVSVQISEKILEYVHSLITDLDVIIFSDYGKGVFKGTLASDIIELARKNNVAVMIDPKGRDFSRYNGATVITPNVKELSETLDIQRPRTDKSVVSAGRDLAISTNAEAVLITRSQDGMSLVPAKNNSFGLDHPYHFKSRVIDVYDVSGAGDTVIATLAAFISCGLSLPQASYVANVAAGIVVQKIGTAAIQSRELLSRLSTNSPIRKEIYRQDNWEGASQKIEQWRTSGLKVGFTNGCFDILHAGHVAYLNETRSHCDRLVVGLNTDSSVSRLKGESRPVNREMDRAQVLAALQAVDLVILFGDTEQEEDKASMLINGIKPDIYFKGGDYKEEDIPEARHVRKYGGDIYICNPVEGLSTSLTLEKLGPTGRNTI